MLPFLHLYIFCPFMWNEECEIAVETLKRLLVTCPVLAFPDYTKTLILDASEDGIGAVLSQAHDDFALTSWVDYSHYSQTMVPCKGVGRKMGLIRQGRGAREARVKISQLINYS